MKILFGDFNTKLRRQHIFKPTFGKDSLSIILPVVLYGCETWSFTSREEHRLKVFENRVPRRIFGPEDTVTGIGEDYKMRSLMTCTPHPILFG
jgi:hypothetical protein